MHRDNVTLFGRQIVTKRHQEKDLEEPMTIPLPEQCNVALVAVIKYNNEADSHVWLKIKGTNGFALLRYRTVPA
jgi:hypothetical protein